MPLSLLVAIAHPPLQARHSGTMALLHQFVFLVAGVGVAAFGTNYVIFLGGGGGGFSLLGDILFSSTCLNLTIPRSWGTGKSKL